MCPQERYPDGSGKDESEQSNSEESGEYRFPRSNVSETEERVRLIREGNWRWPDTGKTSNEEARDSAQMLGIVLLYSTTVITIGGAIGAYLIWGK
jgi:hypothetical protein